MEVALQSRGTLKHIMGDLLGALKDLTIFTDVLQAPGPTIQGQKSLQTRMGCMAVCLAPGPRIRGGSYGQRNLNFGCISESSILSQAFLEAVFVQLLQEPLMMRVRKKVLV